MHDMRPANDEIENKFAQSFLNLEPDDLALLLMTTQDSTFRAEHPRLGKYIEHAVFYRTSQLESNLQDACSIQDPFLPTWKNEELANAVVGLERILVLAANKLKIREWVHLFDRLLVTHCLGRWLGEGDLKAKNQLRSN